MFIVTLVCAAATLVVFLAWLLSDRADAGLLFPCLFAATVVCALVASSSIVPTRNAGIVTSWGRPTGRITGAGLKWHAPWESIDDWDASNQTYAHLGESCVWVTIRTGRVCVPVQIEWSTSTTRAAENWASFREADGHTRFEVWAARRVTPQITSTISDVFSDFDPFAHQETAPRLGALYRRPLQEALTAALGRDITVHSIAFESPRYDEETTAKLAEHGGKLADGRNLQLDKVNAKIRKDVTDIDASVNQTARCLSIAEKNDKEPGLCMAGGVALTRQVN